MVRIFKWELYALSKYKGFIFHCSSIKRIKLISMIIMKIATNNWIKTWLFQIQFTYFPGKRKFCFNLLVHKDFFSKKMKHKVFHWKKLEREFLIKFISGFLLKDKFWIFFNVCHPFFVCLLLFIIVYSEFFSLQFFFVMIHFACQSPSVSSMYIFFLFILYWGKNNQIEISSLNTNVRWVKAPRLHSTMRNSITYKIDSIVYSIKFILFIFFHSFSVDKKPLSHKKKLNK